MISALSLLGAALSFLGAVLSILRTVVGVSAALPSLHFGGYDAVIRLRGAGVAVTMKEFITTQVPSLLENYRPAWWLPTGHGQTAYCVMGDFSKVDKVLYERKLLRLADGGTIGLDFTLGHEHLPDETPLLVVKHGLTGGSHESYVRAVLARACAPVVEGGLGMRGVVCNFRGCAGVPLTSAQFYSAGHTDDLRTALSFIRHLYPTATLLGLGFSLGANVMTRYLAEEGDESLISGAVTLACPWNLVDNSRHLHASFLSKHVYSKAMARNVVRVLKRHSAVLSSILASKQLNQQLPEDVLEKILDDNWINGKSLADVDDAIVSKLGGSFAPHGPFPFRDARAYTAWASSHHVLPGVRVPLLALNAQDDPVVRSVPTGCGGNSYVCIAVTHAGGHLGWFEDDGRRWVVRPVLEFLRGLQDIEGKGRRRGRDIALGEEGMWRELGRERIGWRLDKEGELIIADEGAAGLVSGL